MRKTVVMVVVASLVLITGACSQEQETQEVTGVITSVDLESLTDLNGLSLRADDKTYEFVVTEATELDFPPAHLNEHRISGDPVNVVYEEREGRLFALEINDA